MNYKLYNGQHTNFYRNQDSGSRYRRSNGWSEPQQTVVYQPAQPRPQVHIQRQVVHRPVYQQVNYRPVVQRPVVAPVVQVEQVQVPVKEEQVDVQVQEPQQPSVEISTPIQQYKQEKQLEEVTTPVQTPIESEPEVQQPSHPVPPTNQGTKGGNVEEQVPQKQNQINTSW
jgi:hypothetical protein